ncbi:hypothetical protein ACSSS7_006768 [Eimeria intestinalis]
MPSGSPRVEAPSSSRLQNTCSLSMTLRAAPRAATTKSAKYTFLSSPPLPPSLPHTCAQVTTLGRDSSFLPPRRPAPGLPWSERVHPHQNYGLADGARLASRGWDVLVLGAVEPCAEAPWESRLLPSYDGSHCQYHGGCGKRGRSWVQRLPSSFFISRSARRNAGEEYGLDSPPASGREQQDYPRDLEAFQQALSRLDSRFMQIAKETVSRRYMCGSARRNAEILRCLGFLWRQRRLEQLQDEEQRQASEARSQGPLYGASEEAAPGRQSGSLFRARAYRLAFEIMSRARIPIHNVAEVLLLLREGGLLLRGEETHFVKRGSFRSAVLQKIHIVLAQGLGELIRKSRSAMREGAVQDLSRLPGVTRKIAAVLFDELSIDTPEALKERLASLPPSTSLGEKPNSGGQVEGASCLPASGNGDDAAALSRLFPTALSRKWVLHADAFAASMDASEFDEWQQQLLLVQDALRREETFMPLLEGKEAASNHQGGVAVSSYRAAPVLSLGGGLFKNSNHKLAPLSLQVSLLPLWTQEEGEPLPAALDQAVCSGGKEAGPAEKLWVQKQWELVTRAYRRTRVHLLRRLVHALQQRYLVSEIIQENPKTGVTHAAGRLPWRRETYRLLTVSVVPPRAFPFASLASRCSAPAFRLLQTQARKRWGCSVTPSGLTPAASVVQEAGEEAQAPSLPSNDGRSVLELDAREVDALAERALWVFDEEGVLRLLDQPLSMAARVGQLEHD